MTTAASPLTAALALLSALARPSAQAGGDSSDSVLVAAVHAADTEEERRDYVAQTLAARRLGYAAGLASTVVLAVAAVRIATLAVRQA